MINNIIGQKIGVFDVIADSGKRRLPSGNVLWIVRCEWCKHTRLMTYNHIKRFLSCGCKREDIQSASIRKSLNKGGCGDIYATHWTTIRKNAVSRNLEFKITCEYAWELFLKQNRKCALTGVDLKFPTRCWSRNGTASLDRIESNHGYIESNIQWVHKNINMMKQQYSTELFFDWCKRVVLHNNLLCETPFEQIK